MAEREGLQLLPGTKKRLGIKVRGENRFLYIGSAILGATLVVMFSFARYEASLTGQLQTINDNILALERTRNKNEEQNLRLVKDQIESTSSLLHNHLYWTQAMDKIVSLLQSGVRFKTLSAQSNTKKISISVQATNYSALAKQAASFLTEDSLSNFSITKIAPLTSGIIETGFEIEFDVDKLLKKPPPVE